MYSDKSAEFLDDRMFDLVALGVQNVWICEVGSEAIDGSFEAFQQRLTASKVKRPHKFLDTFSDPLSFQIEVSYTYDDSFIECMVDNQCLSTISSFFSCLFGICSG